MQQVAERLAELLGLAPSDAELRIEAAAEADALIDIAGFTFVV